MAFILREGGAVTKSIRRIVWIGLLSLLAIAMLSACDGGSPPATTELPTNTLAPTNTPKSPPPATPTSTPVPIVTPEPTATSMVPIPEPTSTPVPIATPEPTATSMVPTPEPTPTQAPIVTPEPTATSMVPTPEPTSTPVPIVTPEPTATSMVPTPEPTPSGRSRGRRKLPTRLRTQRLLAYLAWTRARGTTQNLTPTTPSILQWMPRGTCTRRRHPSLGSGELAFGQVRGWVVIEVLSEIGVGVGRGTAPG